MPPAPNNCGLLLIGYQVAKQSVMSLPFGVATSAPTVFKAALTELTCTGLALELVIAYNSGCAESPG